MQDILREWLIANKATPIYFPHLPTQAFDLEPRPEKNVNNSVDMYVDSRNSIEYFVRHRLNVHSYYARKKSPNLQNILIE